MKYKWSSLYRSCTFHLSCFLAYVNVLLAAHTCLFFVCAWCLIFCLHLKIGEKLYLVAACNVMLSYKIWGFVYKSMEKEDGGKIICSTWALEEHRYGLYVLQTRGLRCFYCSLLYHLVRNCWHAPKNWSFQY